MEIVYIMIMAQNILDNSAHRFYNLVKQIFFSQDFGPDIIGWLSFIVFVNASNLWCQEPSPEDGITSWWSIVDGLFRSCIAEQLMHVDATMVAPGKNVSVLVQVVTEPFSWHILVIQSCIRSMLPSGKKKKKTGLGDQLNSPDMQAVRHSIQCLNDMLLDLCRWTTGQINRPEEQNLDDIMSHIQKRDTEEDGPGPVVRILEESTSTRNSELGERISAALQSWSSATVCRKIYGARNKMLSQLLCICESKLKLLHSIKQSL